MIKTYFKVALLAVLAVGAIMVISCEKEENEVLTSNQAIVAKSAVTDEDIYLGEVDNGKIIYAFDVDKLSEFIYQEGGIYTVEKFEILDSTLIDGIVEAYVVLYNVQEEVTESLWFEIKKDENKYFLNEDLVKVSSNSNTNIRCVSSTICIGSCWRKYDEKGRLLGCECSFLGGCDLEKFLIEIVTMLKDAIITISF